MKKKYLSKGLLLYSLLTIFFSSFHLLSLERVQMDLNLSTQEFV